MTDYKLWYFGRSIRHKNTKYAKFSWDDLLKEEELILLIGKHSLNAHQVNCIKTGFNGGSHLDINECAGKFPFGVHKGKRFEDVPERYIVWCSKQTWLDKWPTVKNYIAKFFNERDGGMSKEEMIQFLNED